jgi:radical SAM protein with 4Fe4S-binding SPASM domain
MSRRLDILHNDFFPAYVVWELTLLCDQRCAHCGSRAKRARPGELTHEEAMVVVEDLIKLKAGEVILIGGEAYLHGSFLEIIKALTEGGIRVGLTTGGQNITLERALAIRQAGCERVSVSIDGLAETHDRLRAKIGSFIKACEALKIMQQVGIRTTINTTISKLNKHELEDLYAYFKLLNITAWQVQIIAALGRAADRLDLLLDPYDLLDIIPRIAELKKQAFKDNILIMPGNNLGYFGPHEALLRSLKPKDRDYFAGCQAGKFILGIESDGTIKGCPSLQTYYYQAGNVKQKRLSEIWEHAHVLRSMRENTFKELWGFCKTCDFAATCQGGCSFTSHALFGKAGNNPYCFHRAQTLAKSGFRERLIRIKKAPGKPFDHALFACELESI